MDWKWYGLFTILWNMLVYAVTFQWDRLRQEQETFRNWWADLWDRISSTATSIATSVRDAWRTWISDIANDAWNAWNQAWAAWQKIGSTLQEYAYDIGHYIAVQINNTRNHAIGLVNGAITLTYTVRDTIYSVLYPYIDSWIAWVTDRFEWVTPYYDLIVNWLTGARAVIDWLWYQAWAQLQAFLSDSVGWVLGWLLTPITNIVNWWATWGDRLHGFVSEDLVRLRNLLARGFQFLDNFVDNPLDEILNLLAPVVIDWLEDQIAERW